MKSFFTPKEVAKLVNISYRQIQYWDKTNFIRPSYRRRGKYRLYTFSDLIQLKVARTLRDHDFSIQRLRKTIVSLKDLLPQVAHPLVELTFLIEGDRILVFNGEVLMNNVPGQNYIRFDVKSLREEINTHFPEALSVVAGQKMVATG
ncbi:MAG: MerR family transcriptional regulator [Candidatus Wallbacteria bacterium]|nr:MerR family transcriptional regulator [Candidatus Wallbacteria bacterium]